MDSHFHDSFAPNSQSPPNGNRYPRDLTTFPKNPHQLQRLPFKRARLSSSSTSNRSHFMSVALLAESSSQSSNHASTSIPLSSPQSPQSQSQQDPSYSSHLFASPNVCPSVLDPSVHSDKFTKSRAVGQFHRDNEKHLVSSIAQEIEDLKNENSLLLSILQSRCKMPNLPSSNAHTSVTPQVAESRLSYDRPEDFNLTEDEAGQLGMLKLSTESSALLRQQFISPHFAVVLMEIILTRWNVVHLLPNSHLACKDPPLRKRRTSFRTAISQEQAETVFQFATSLIQRHAPFFSSSPVFYHKCLPPQTENVFENVFLPRIIDARMGSLSVLLARFEQFERHYNPPGLECYETDEIDVLSCRPPLTDHFDPLAHKRDRAKRCTRCLKYKVSGSGHGRSKCDDGHSISSTVPYPASTPIPPQRLSPN